jgi:hypothetical protein
VNCSAYILPICRKAPKDYRVKTMESVSKSSGMEPSSILSIIGGSLMVAGGIFALSMFGFWSQAGMGGWGMMDGWGTMSGYFGWPVGTMAAVSMAAGALAIAGGYAIYRKPAGANVWGAGILIASIAGLFTMSGFFVGAVLGIIGGILALTKK